MRVVVKGYEVEQYDSVESSDADERSLYIFMYDFGTFLVTGLLIFEVLSSVVFALAEQCSKIFLLVFTFRVNIKTACDICGLEGIYFYANH